MHELISTICKGLEIQLCWRPEVSEIKEYMDKGFIPIEMAEGSESYVDFRCLDHHNMYSHMPSACVTALKYYDTVGRDCDVSRFMVNHTDADSALTGLTLMGLLPYETLEKFNIEVGLLDTDPLNVDRTKLFYGKHISLWQTGMMSVRQSGWSWLYGIQLFLDIFENFSFYGKKLEKIEEMEKVRIDLVREDYQNALFSKSGKVLLINPSRAKGFDVHFGRETANAGNSLEGWRHWCVAAKIKNSGNVTLASPNKNVAELAFGPGGLMNVYKKLPSLNGKEWGGRESIGGSPRGAAVPDELLGEILEIIEASLSGFRR